MLLTDTNFKAPFWHLVIHERKKIDESFICANNDLKTVVCSNPFVDQHLKVKCLSDGLGSIFTRQFSSPATEPQLEGGLDFDPADLQH